MIICIKKSYISSSTVLHSTFVVETQSAKERKQRYSMFEKYDFFEKLCFDDKLISFFLFPYQDEDDGMFRKDFLYNL